MNARPRPSGRVVRTLAAALVAVLGGGCVDGSSPTGAGFPVALELMPDFQVVSVPFPSAPVDQIVSSAFAVSDGEILATSDTSVDPNATEWELSLSLLLSEEASVEVFVEVELLSGGVVQWSGRSAPFTVGPGISNPIRSLPVFRGGLENLDVAAVTIDEAPVQLLAGSTLTLSATATLVAGSTASPTVYWFSDSPTVATVDTAGVSVSFAALAPGTVSVVAGAGRATDTVTIGVLPEVSAVSITPAAPLLDGLGVTTQLAAQVVDGFGMLNPVAAVAWSTDDASVATVDSTGLVTSVGFGTAEVQATSGGVTATASVSVRGPDLVPTSFAVIPDGQSGIASLALTGFQVDVENQGAVDAGPTSLEVRILDAVSLAEAHPPLTFNAPAIPAGDTYQLQDVGGGQIQSLPLPASLTFEVEVDADADVPEVDESNQVAADGPFDVADLAPPGFDTEWRGGTSSDWATATNWSAGIVPRATDNVYVPLTSTEPVLTVGATVADLSLAAGATLTLVDAVLIVNGNLDAGTTIDGSGTVRLDGTGTTAEGVIVPDVAIGGTVQAVSDFTLSGNVGLAGTLTVPSGVTTAVGGTLTLDVGSTLDVEGTVTAGTCVNLGGALLGGGSQPCPPAQFTKAWVGGTPGSPTAWEHDDNWSPQGAPTSADTVLVDATINGPVLSANAAVGGLTVQGVEPVDLNGNSLTVSGDLNAPTPIANGTVVVSGVGVVLQGTVPALQVAGDRTLSGSLTVTGSMTLNSADVTVGANTLTVLADFTVQGGAAELFMADPLSVLDVAGNATINGGNSSGDLTAGAIRLAGDLTVSSSSSSQSFSSTGTLVELDGTGPQTLSFASPGGTTQRFQDLLVDKPSGTVTLATDVYVTGTLTAQGGAIDASDDVVSIGGAYVDPTNLMSVQEVRIVGQVSTVPATIPANVRVDANWVLPSSVTVTGSMTLNSADVTVGANTLTVLADFTVQGGAAELFMADPLSVLDVAGNATINGGNSSGDLTAGAIRLAGDLTVSSSSSSQSFSSTGTLVELDGTGPQTLSFASPGGTTQRFQDLLVDKPSGTVTLATDVYVTGTLTAQGGAIDASDDVVSIGGAYVDPTNLMSVQEVRIVGQVSTVPATIPANVRVDANWVLPSSVTVTGSMTLNSADVTVGANTLTVLADFTVQGGAAELFMADPLSVLDVAGNATINGGNSSGDLTAGAIRLAGDLTVSSSSSSQSFSSTGTLVELDGTGPQTLSFASPGGTTQRFQDLLVDKPSGTVTLATDVYVTGTLTAQGGAIDASDDVVSIGGAYVDPTNLMSVQEVRIVGQVSTVPATIPANVRVDANWVLPSSVTVTGSMTLNSADVTVGANTLTVLADFTVQGGAAELFMADPLSVLDVAGNATINGGNSSGDLTAGAIRLAGDLTVSSSSSSQSFSSTGTLVELDGTGPQTLSFASPGGTTQRFQDLLVDKPSGTVTLATDVYVTGTLTAQGGAIDASDDVVSIGGAYVDPTNLMSVQEIQVVGNLTAFPPTLTANLTVLAAWTLPADLTATGAVNVLRPLTIGGNRLLVTGDVATSGGSALIDMTNTADTLDVVGDVTFDGGSQVGWLTAGYLRLTGNFTALASSSSQSFASTADHETVFLGGGVQNISLSSPGLTTQRFADLTIANFSGSVDLLSTVFVTDTLEADDVTMRRAAAGATLEARGTAIFSELTLDGLPIRVDSSVPGSAHTFSLMTFTNMSANDIQLDLRLPGGVNFPASLNDMVFDIANVSPGLHLRTERGPGGLPTESLNVFVTNPNFGNLQGASFQALTGSVIFWP